MERSKIEAETSADPVLRLRESELADTKVVVDPLNRDLFVLTGRQLIESCGLSLSVQLYVDEAGLAVAELGEWAAERSNQVTSIHWEPRPGHLSLYVAVASEAFDFDLADEMTDLSLRLNREFTLGRVEVFQIPNDAIDRFVSSPERSRVWPSRSS